jgi:hypothetical protein
MFASKDTLLTRPSGGYNIARSVRLRSSASAYFNRTPASASNRKTWTWSGWVKRGLSVQYGGLFTAWSSNNASDYAVIRFDDDQLVYKDWVTVYRQTSQVFRDFSAWYHIVVAIDTTQATAADRVRMYVNGVQVTAFATSNNITQNSDTNVNNTVIHTLGVNYFSSAPQYFTDGYLTEINFIDGQALTPSSFGETDSITGVWKPKAYSGTYGTNGFELNFSDNSASTAATIGKDYSGNGNNWTPNNISVTAGVTYDSMQDVPTLTSLTAANYSVFNPLDVYTSSGTITVSNGNLAYSTSSGGNHAIVRGTIAPSSGKFYWEATLTTVGGGWPSIGVMLATTPLAPAGSASYVGYYSTSYGYNATNTSGSGTFYNNNSGTTYGAFYTAGDVIGVAFDATTGSITFYKNGASQGVATSSIPTGLPYSPTFSCYNLGAWSINFGQQPFTYTPPTGFVALNTYNLPASTITNGAAYMAATLYTGNGSTQSINNAVGSTSFQPDFVWIKSRSVAYNNYLEDSVRGAGKDLSSNATDAEATYSLLSSFNSNGFTDFTNGTYLASNQSGATYVAWQWKAGTTSASNTNGSITSTVSAGATQGFSVVTYTGTGVTATVGHGLGGAPSMIIVKNRSAVESWRVGHSFMNGGSSPWNYYMNLNATSAQAASSSVWNNTAPTSSVFTISNDSAVSGNGQSHVAYCFSAVAGYSAFGSYTGNGSADGPFVFLGFRPRWVMFKNTTTGAGWLIFDSSRNTYNLTDLLLQANQANAEAGNSTDNPLDFLSNGFKLRYSNSATNASAEVYIYAAFAENPFKYANAR